MNAERWLYLDSSALVKLVVSEPESAALGAFLNGTSRWTSSALARVEVILNTRAHGAAATQYARELLAEFDLIPVDQSILNVAADLDSPGLRSLDAIHIASAQSVLSELQAVVTYDARMTRAAETIGLPVASPA
jgi:predicted nucleic acid-binding protein